MEPVFSSHLKEQQLITISTDMLQAVLDMMPIGVQILQAIRNNKNEIIDFRYTLVNKVAANYSEPGKTLFNPDRSANKNTIDTWIAVVEKGIPASYNEPACSSDKASLVEVKCIKFGDGIVITRENIPAEKSISNEKISVTPGVINGRPLHSEINMLPEVLKLAEELTDTGSWEYNIVTGKFNCSKGMYHLFGLTAGSILSPEIYLEYTNGDDRKVAQTIVNRMKYKFTPFEEQLTIDPRQGEKKIIRIKANVITDEKKNPVTMIGINMNITGQIKAAARIQEMNQTLLEKNHDLASLNAELRSLNGVAAKDYKGTLQVLYTNLEYIATNEARYLSNTAKANIRRAQSAIQKMKLLTDDINIYLELYESEIILSPVDPNEILRHVLSILQKKIGQYDVQIEVTPFPVIPSHPKLLSLLLIKLIDNAIKYRKLVTTPVVKIKYSQADEMNAVPGARKNMPYGIISVSDNGIGFRETEAEKIFNLFYRVDDKSSFHGSGIGLSVCKKIMDLHGGFITAEGIPANGAIFTCYFPLIQK